MSFADILKGPEKEGKEKHVPVIELDSCCGDEPNIVRVIVGKEVPHPNTLEHHIAWVELYGEKEGGAVVCLGKMSFAPGVTRPVAVFSVPVKEFKKFHALEYCNIHGVWSNTLEA